MDPLIHARNSVKKYGGEIHDYLNIHRFLDTSKKFIPDFRHRLILHNTMGIFLGEEFLGKEVKNSDGKYVSTRKCLEDHVFEDLLEIPTIEQILLLISPHDKKIMKYSSIMLGLQKRIKSLISNGKLNEEVKKELL